MKFYDPNVCMFTSLWVAAVNVTSWLTYNEWVTSLFGLVFR